MPRNSGQSNDGGWGTSSASTGWQKAARPGFNEWTLIPASWSGLVMRNKSGRRCGMVQIMMIELLAGTWRVGVKLWPSALIALLVSFVPAAGSCKDAKKWKTGLSTGGQLEHTAPRANATFFVVSNAMSPGHMPACQARLPRPAPTTLLPLGKFSWPFAHFARARCVAFA